MDQSQPNLGPRPDDQPCGFICRPQVCSAMSDIGDPLLLLLLLLSMLLLLLLPSSPGARPGDTVRRRSPIVTCGADQRSIARSLAPSSVPLQLACLPKPSTSSSSSTIDHHQICTRRPPAWNFACVPMLCRGTAPWQQTASRLCRRLHCHRRRKV